VCRCGRGAQPKYISDVLQVGSVESNALPSTAALTLVVTSGTFDPERHAALLTVSFWEGGACVCALLSVDSAAQVLVGIYIDSGTPVKIAEGFLAVFTTGNAAPPPLQPARHSI
jgi:hypothetical protein